MLQRSLWVGRRIFWPTLTYFSFPLVELLLGSGVSHPLYHIILVAAALLATTACVVRVALFYMLCCFIQVSEWWEETETLDI